MSRKEEDGILALVELFEHQVRFVDSTSQHPLLSGGLGCGKSHAGIVRCIKMILENKDTFNQTGLPYMYGIFMPNYSYFKMQIIPQIELLLKKLGITDYTVNKSDLIIKIGNYAEIKMKTLENPDKIVSFEVHDSWIDELDIMTTEKASESFFKVNQRTRAKKISGINTVCCTSTPNGGTLGFLYKKWVYEPKKNKRLLDLYEVIYGETRNNLTLSKDYLFSAFSGGTMDYYLQMGKGQFIDVSTMPVYTRYSAYACNSDELWNGEELHIGMDFNVNNMSGVVAIFKDDVCHIIDELVTKTESGDNIKDTPEMIDEILLRYPNAKIYVYPDASGNNKSAANHNETNVSKLKENFIVRLNYRRNPSKPVNPSIADSVLVLNQHFRVDIFINSDRCPNLKKNLLSQQYVKKDGKYTPDKSKGDDHMIDALRYLTYYHFRPRVKKHRNLSKFTKQL